MPSPTAAEILERTRALYATCRTYLDEGEHRAVITTAANPDAPMTLRKLFRTAFVRDSAFFFEYREVEHPVGPHEVRGVVWSNAGSAHKWWSIGGPYERESDLATLLAGFAGVSGGTSVDVPAMLMPNQMAQRLLPNPNQGVLLGTAIVAGAECARIEGRRYERNSQAVLSIETSTGALLRLEMRREFIDAKLKENDELMHQVMLTEATPEQREIYLRIREQHPPVAPQPFTGESTTTWRPRFDVEIDPATFEFTPPS